MMTEKQIRKEMELFNNQLQNAKMLFERTGQESFRQIVYDTELTINTLRFVLGEVKFEDDIKIVETKDLNF
jgi:hypothetical protein